MANICANFQGIGQDFVKHYYQTFDTNRPNLAALYSNDSMLTFEGQQFQGAQAIMTQLTSLPFKKVQHQVVKCDCQPNPSNGGVIVFVTGQLIVDDENQALQFAQAFHLAPSNPGAPNSGFFCLNDLFRLNIA